MTLRKRSLQTVFACTSVSDMKEMLSTAPCSTLVTAKEAADLLPSTGYQSLLRWARHGKIASVRLPNGRVFFQRGDIEELLRPSVSGRGREPTAAGLLGGDPGEG